MTWPFVTRARFDDLKASLERERAILMEWRQLALDLQEKLHALKLQGASVPEPKPVLARKAVDPVTAAITDRAGTDRKLRGVMSKEVARLRKSGLSDEDIIAQIQAGHHLSDDDGIPQ